jgi:hypothetical protein
MISGDWNARIYSRILTLYPDDLRRDFGMEMALLFAEDLAAARLEAGISGVLRVWRCALREVFQLALPHRVSNPAVVVPGISFVLSLVPFTMSMMGRLLHLYGEPVSAPLLARAIEWALLPSAAAAIVSYASVRICARRPAILLGLDQ